MNIELTQQIKMVGACIGAANEPDNQAVWQGKPPEDFETDLGDLSDGYDAVLQKDALADAAAGGGGDAKAQAEHALENVAFVLCRALANHFKKTGNLTALAQVDFNKTDIVKLRDHDLLDRTTAIRDLASATVSETDASKRGVTAARITALTNAINAYKAVINLPRGQVVNRATLKQEVATDTAALASKVADMDDLVVQFDGTDAGKRFIAAWKQARSIVEIGSHSTGTSPAPTPAPQNATATGSK